ncbi:MAG: hypothetical protein LKH33_08270 [Acetobacter sp.]|nr:hypothetical protein [Acetobacter sp.]MCI1485788.1 hypothetical protein [Acetobacter sp.]MCI1529832.1 hypothetical protein [Acetobacter sp.]MCI1587501.1 hypothetical protein [Acetobacter sp.]MCI1601717.1 hypothetical protein [Acetobacter sp.]
MASRKAARQRARPGLARSRDLWRLPLSFPFVFLPPSLLPEAGKAMAGQS